MKLTPPDDTRVNTVCSLCSLALPALCWVFLRTNSLQNPEKTGHLSLTEGRMCRAYSDNMPLILMVKLAP